MNRIADLLHRKRAGVAKRKQRGLPGIPPEDRRLNWNKEPFRILAEIKRVSLSAGPIRPDLDLMQIASAYERAGASAISVLTEEHYFGGSLEDLRQVRKAVRIPLLQKDFILDEFQILEAKQAGADFILLIARFLTPEEIQSMLQVCETNALNAIVEISDENDLEKIRGPVRYLGVNSRDLETLQVDRSKFERMRAKLPQDAFLIAESGINTVEFLQSLQRLGYNGALIGEHLLRAEEPSQELQRFVESTRGSGTKQYGTKVKICGITNEQDALLAIDSGASALGFIFAESPRAISVKQLQAFRNRISIPCVGVFRGNSPEQIESIIQECLLDIAQVYDDHSAASIETWQAQTAISLQEVTGWDHGSRKSLIDIKVRDSELPEAWRALKDKNVFALAGGLHADNVSHAISICRPQWVDVARGVERESGLKDAQKLRKFMEAVKL